MLISGLYENAIIYSDENNIELQAIEQIKDFLNQPYAKGSNVRIMPDVHSGSGCVIGFTAKLTDVVVPNIIGVDIGCGVIAWKLGRVNIDFKKLDDFIRTNIPHGNNVRNSLFNFNSISSFNKYHDLLEKIDEVKNKLMINSNRFDVSLGTLGSGNHFLEIDIDEEGNYWFIVHSGSRNFGLQIANAYHKIAKLFVKENCIDVPSKLEYLVGKDAQNYFNDMEIAQNYASLNRRIMGYVVINDFFNLNYDNTEYVESVHNYIDFKYKIIRKGSISAQKGEQVIIPLSMADGIIIGTGKGNENWNCSAPHGAGRKLSRNVAKSILSFDDFSRVMAERNIWSSCISKKTLDESPMAYKDEDSIIKYLKETVNIERRLRPVYNFKAD